MAESLDVISEQLKHLNKEVDKNFSALDNLEEILSKGITVKDYKETKFGYPDESPFEKENRLEKLRLEADQHQEIMNIFEVINQNVLKILNALKMGAVNAGSSLSSLLGKGLSLAGLTALLAAPVSAIIAPLNKIAGFFSKKLKGAKSLEAAEAGALEGSKVVKEAEKVLGTATAEQKIAKAEKVLGTATAEQKMAKVVGGIKKEEAVTKAVTNATKASKLEKLFGFFQTERVFPKIEKAFRPVLKFIGELAGIFGKIWSFIVKNPILRFASKLAKVILVPLTIILGIIEVLRGIAAGYDKDGVKGAIVGALAAFVDFITFGLIPFDDIYKSLKESTDSVTASYKLFVQGKVEEGFRELGKAVGSFAKTLIETIVKSLSHLGGWIMDLFGFKEVAEKLRAFGDNFNFAESIDDVVKAGASGITKAGKYTGLLADTDEESATPVKGPDLGVLKRVYEDSSLALMKAEPGSLEADNLQAKAQSAKQSYNKELERRQKVNPLTISGFEPIPDVVTTPFVKAYDPDSLVRDRKNREAQMEKTMSQIQKPVVIYNTPVQNVTPPATPESKSPIIAPIPVRNNESTWRIQQNSNISWN